MAYLDVLAIDAETRAAEGYRSAMMSQLERVRALVEVDRALSADALRIEVALSEAELAIANLAARRELASEGAAHAAGGAEEDDVHGRSPKMRTDCALRSSPSGSYLRRTAWKRSTRGSIARNSSAVVKVSLVR